ncbi:Glycogen(Starch) synthase [uncultured Paludibacter sp.]|nr:Glycogen(Starch) synthase [uncultured Paludibacter sp.]
MELLKPEYIFEASWEVCNMVGGIYTVLSTKAETLEKELKDNLIFIGPDVWKEKESPYFQQDDHLLSDWKNHFIQETGLKIRIGRWKIHGNPVSILIDFTPLYYRKNEIYSHVWEKFGVNSIAAYGDYDESSMFGYSTGMIIESYYRYFNLSKKNNVIAHFNEWMTTFGIYYVKEKVPEIATVFTTHATTIGRSIAGNHKPLYDYLNEYNGDQMAFELNVVSKHSTEKIAAHAADCFTTVSKITGIECKQLLEKTPDIITPNGFEDSFVPKGEKFDEKRKAARNRLQMVAEILFGYKLKEDTLFVSTAGRYEYKNKGIDIFIESLKNLSLRKELKKEVVAFIMVPAHIQGARADLMEKLQNPEARIDYWNKHTTHELYDYQYDNIISALRWFHFTNEKDEKVKIIFVPSYLNGSDGVFNMTYWDLLIGMDISVFPSYYEPWGYTPLESVAFSVPTITTDLSGFGQWMLDNFENEKGTAVVHRSDYNTSQVIESIGNVLFRYINKTKPEIKECRNTALKISQKALWDEFIQYYDNAYHIALQKKK